MGLGRVVAWIGWRGGLYGGMNGEGRKEEMKGGEMEVEEVRRPQELRADGHE